MAGKEKLEHDGVNELGTPGVGVLRLLQFDDEETHDVVFRRGDKAVGVLFRIGPILRHPLGERHLLLVAGIAKAEHGVAFRVTSPGPVV